MRGHVKNTDIGSFKALYLSPMSQVTVHRVLDASSVIWLIKQITHQLTCGMYIYMYSCVSILLCILFHSIMYTAVHLHAGMSLGLLISAVCGTEYSALQVALACFYPAILLSGRLWCT